MLSLVRVRILHAYLLLFWFWIAGSVNGLDNDSPAGYLPSCDSISGGIAPPLPEASLCKCSALSRGLEQLGLIPIGGATNRR